MATTYRVEQWTYTDGPESKTTWIPVDGGSFALRAHADGLLSAMARAGRGWEYVLPDTHAGLVRSSMFGALRVVEVG